MRKEVRLEEFFEKHIKENKEELEMVKIYELAAGRKVRVLGAGLGLTEAIYDALENGYFYDIEGIDPDNIDKLENYILGANCDYKVEYK